MKAVQYKLLLAAQSPRIVLGTILLVGLLHGLFYTFLIPPWQHNDEPGHFEYAYLAAHFAHWPRTGEFDPQFRGRLVDALQATSWYKKYPSSDPTALVAPFGSEIGVPQAGDIPGYYFLASLVLRPLAANTSLVTQMYLLRLFSLGLSLVTLVLAWKAMEELVPTGNALRWMVPAFLALLPGYADMMTAISNDVGGVAAGTLLIWLSLRWLRRGTSAAIVLGWGGALAICLFMNESSRLLVLAAPLVPLLHFLKGKALGFALVGAACVLAAFSLAGLQSGGAAHWYQSPSTDVVARARNDQAPFGQDVLEIGSVPTDGWLETGQFVIQDEFESLRAHEITIGVWIWAQRPTTIALPYVVFMTTTAPIDNLQWQAVTTEPTFYALGERVPFEALRGVVQLIPPEVDTDPVIIYYDGFVLAQGSFPAEAPQFSDPDLSHGVWAGRPFINLIRNPSLERGSLTVRPWVDRLTMSMPIVRGRSGIILSGLQDWEATGWYYRASVSKLFQTFWARVAGGNLSLPGLYDYDLLQLLTLLAVVGLAHLLWRRPETRSAPQSLFLGTAFLLLWIAAVFRGAPELEFNSPVIPYARYAGPVIVISALLICSGWREACEWMVNRWGLEPSFPPAAFLAAMGGVALYATLSFWQKYNGSAIHIARVIFFGLLIWICFQGFQRSLSWFRSPQNGR